ncbi:MAG: preprotein translocase subunit YajC [Croceibacterium sp.]
MTVKNTALRVLPLLAACAWPGAGHAQDTKAHGDKPDSGRHHVRSGKVQVTPYIEVGQVFSAQLSPVDDVVTYSSVAAGVDASITGRNSAASASVRYERRFGWDGNARDGDAVSGVARASIAIAPHAVTLEAGALAQRTSVQGNGSATLGGLIGNDSSSSQIYAGYVGPSVHTMAGDVEVEGHYRFGYTRVEEPNALVTAPGGRPADIFDESTAHVGYVRAGVRPNVVAPIGVGVGAGWNEQNVSNLDQRIRDRNVRGDVTVPVSPTVAVVGGVGYEDVEVSSRDAQRDANGTPVIGRDGRYVTDQTAPRRIAYQTEGLIWDAGVMWRPSRRTSFEGYIGRRYGSFTGWGSLAYAPDSRTSLNVAVYDNLTSFGGLVTDTLAALPASFEAFRNPITGEIGGCVANTGAQLGGRDCIAGALSSVRSAVFRSRGVAASYSHEIGRMQLGLGAGYDRRKFIAASGTVLASVNGLVDETIWVAAYANTRLDRQSTVSANAYANWFNGGFALDGDTMGYSASLAYNRTFLDHLSGTAAVGLDGITRDDLPDFTTASALLGLRYSF